jgi:hypothetical protein
LSREEHAMKRNALRWMWIGLTLFSLTRVSSAQSDSSQSGQASRHGWDSIRTAKTIRRPNLLTIRPSQDLINRPWVPDFRREAFWFRARI